MDANELETYQVQLSQVELALTQDPTNAELTSLHTELSELIELTKAALAGPSSASTNATSSKKQPQNGATSMNGGKAWAAGDDCLAKYSGDDKWYPARITTVSGATNNRVYTVVFRKYNNTEQLKASEIKAIPPSMLNNGWDADESSIGKRKARVEDEQTVAEKEKKKKKNEKKLEVRAAKAKEQNEKQASWQNFAKKSEKKGIHIAGVAGTSIFKTPENPLGKGRCSFSYSWIRVLICIISGCHWKR